MTKGTNVIHLFVILLTSLLDGSCHRFRQVFYFKALLFISALIAAQYNIAMCLATGSPVSAMPGDESEGGGANDYKED